MARSTCVKCGSNRFETVDSLPDDAPFSMMFVQCASCGGVVGVLDGVYIGRWVRALGEGLSRVAGYDVKP